MSTRCWIGQKREDGIHSFYCHHDGYPSYVGGRLVNCYNTEELATELINLCEPYGTSSLEKTLNETKRELYTDDGVSNSVYKNKKEYEENAGFDIEYIYLYDKGDWKVFKSGRFKSLKDCEKRALEYYDAHWKN